MGLRINTNVQSLIGQHKLASSLNSLNLTQERMASGTRIVRAMDDAAGLAISENLRATMRATGENIRNAQNGFFLLQTADGALNEISQIIIRMKELTMQAASDTNGAKERGYLDNEYQALKAEIDRIANTTLYNGRPLLNAEGGHLDIQIGPNNVEGMDRITVSSNLDVTTDTLGLASLSVVSGEAAREAIDPLGEALDVIATVRADIGASESRLSSTISSLKQYEENSSGAYSQIRDADMAFETSQLAKYNILNQAGAAVLAQANSSPALALKLMGS